MTKRQNDQQTAIGVHESVAARLGRRGPNLARLITLVFSLFLVAAAGWSSVTQVPGLVRATGELVAEGALRRVEHLDGGTVETINATDGQRVSKGDVLVQFSTASIDIELDQLEGKDQAASETIYRLNALLSYLPEDPTPESNLVRDPDSLRLQKAQLNLRNERRRAAAKLIRERASAVKKVRAIRDTTQKRVEGMNTRVRAFEKLAERGAISKLELNARQDERDALIAVLLQNEADLAATLSRQADAENAYSELMLSEREDTLKELEETIEIQAEIRNQIRQTELKKHQLAVRSPIDGVVQTVSVGTHGEIVEPGGHVADILPIGVDLVADVRIAVQDIGQVQAGEAVALNVTTYPRNRFGQILGEIISLSPTSFEDPETEPYYKAKVALDRQFIGIGEARHPLRSGMTVQAEIVTNSRTVAEYLLKPLEATLSSTMREK